MDFKRKRRLTFSVVALYQFLGGCEYAIIFPTIWDYLQSLGVQEEHWVGFIVAAYSFSGAIAGLVGGRLADKYESRTKLIVLTSVALMITGSIQYAMGYSPWNLFIARLICGTATAATAALISQVCRATDKEERTPVLAVCNATRQVGILIGPGLQLIVHKMDFRIGPFPVNSLNATGLFMAIIWIIFFIYALFMFHDLSEGIQEMKRANETTATLNIGNFITKTDDAIQNNPQAIISATSLNDDIRNIEDEALISEDSSEDQISTVSALAHDPNAKVPTTTAASGSGSNYVTDNENRTSDLELSTSISVNMELGVPLRNVATYQRYKDEFLTDSVVVLLGMGFTLVMSQMAIEAVIPVVMQTYFNFGIFENSLVYMVGGVESLIISVLLFFMSKSVRDTTLLIMGWIFMILVQVWLLVVMPYFKAGEADQVDIICYLAGIVMLFMIYPIAFTSITGLYSKCLSHETQGLGQGIFRLFSYIGLVFGPLWGGASIKYTYWALGVPVSIMVIHSILFAFSFKRLRKVETPEEQALQFQE